VDGAKSAGTTSPLNAVRRCKKGDVVPQCKMVGWGEILLMGFPEQQACLERNCPSALTVAEGKAAGHPGTGKAISHELRFNTSAH